jgi:ketosteroid isomerase-like protein
VDSAHPTPAEVAQQILDAWNRGEEPLKLGLLADDIEYVNPPDALEPGTRRGTEGWRVAMRGLGESFELQGIDVQRVLEAGDRVALLVTFRIRGRTSGIDAHQEQGYVFTVRDGKATRFEWWNSHRDTLERWEQTVTDER